MCNVFYWKYSLFFISLFFLFPEYHLNHIFLSAKSITLYIDISFLLLQNPKKVIRTVSCICEWQFKPVWDQSTGSPFSGFLDIDIDRGLLQNHILLTFKLYFYASRENEAVNLDGLFRGLSETKSICNIFQLLMRKRLFYNKIKLHNGINLKRF